MSKKNPQAPNLYAQVVESIKNVAQTVGIDPRDLTRADYSKHGSYTHNQIKSLGGLTNILAKEFGPPQRDMKVVRDLHHHNSYVKGLENKLGDKQLYFDRLEQAIRDAFAYNPLPTGQKKPVKVSEGTTRKRENVAFISDTHFGIFIDKKEVPCNHYNWQVACRRMAKYFEQVASYKLEHRAQSPQVRLCLGGDLAQGIIHLSENGTQLLTEQIYGSAWILIHGIEHLRQSYSRVVVECTPDNHLRMVHKGHDRARAQKWDSYATLLHLMLQLAFRDCPDVIFNIPKTPYTEFDVLGHRYYLTHGDTILNSGNVGKSVPIERISNEIMRQQAAATKKLDVVMLGHVHVPLNTTLLDGTELIINGTGSGTDPYAQSIGIATNHPCQVLFEATEDYPVGDFRKVYLKDADAKAAYDKIIPTYDGSLRNPRIR